MYDALNEVLLDNELPAGNECCGYVTKAAYEILTKADATRKMGVTWSGENLLFIALIDDNIEDDVELFNTLVHEIIHAVKDVRNIKGTAHGKEYRKIGREILETLKREQPNLPPPYRHLLIDSKQILAAR